MSSSLLDLPNEAIMTVLDALCLHCIDPGVDSTWEDHNRYKKMWIRQRALAALARTSRRLNALATPHLYHEPKGLWAPLMRTLLERPDLALHVKSLALCEGSPGRKDIREVPAVAAAFVAFAGMPEGWEDREEVEWEDEDEEDEENAWNILDFLFSLCPGLTHLDIDRECGDSVVFPLLEPGALADLRVLRLGYQQTESSWDMDRISRIPVVAPNLATLLCHATGPRFDFPDDLKFEKLTKLALGQSCVPSGTLDRVLRTMPRLESLEFVAGDAGICFIEETLSARELQDVLVRHAPGLKSLEVCLDSSARLENNDTWTSLAGLTRLEHLDFEYTCVFPQDNSPNSPWRVLPRTFFTDLLPASIRTVRYNHGPNCRRIADALLPCLEHLVSAKAVRYPSLRRFELGEAALLGEDAAGDLGAIRSVLEGAGIEFVDGKGEYTPHVHSADEKACLAHFALFTSGESAAEAAPTVVESPQA